MEISSVFSLCVDRNSRFDPKNFKMQLGCPCEEAGWCVENPDK